MSTAISHCLDRNFLVASIYQLVLSLDSDSTTLFGVLHSLKLTFTYLMPFVFSLAPNKVDFALCRHPHFAKQVLAKVSRLTAGLIQV